MDNPLLHFGVPGIESLGAPLCVLLLSLVAVANATLAAEASRRGSWLALLATGNLAVALWAAGRADWQLHSGVAWLWANLAVGLMLGAGLTSRLRLRAGHETVLGARCFWRIAWPVVFPLLVGNMLMAVTRATLLGSLSL